MIKVLKHGLRSNGKYIRASYSIGALKHHPAGTITIYAKSVLDKLPSELNPQNDTEIISDYIEEDRARILPDHPLYNDLLKYARA